MNTVATYGYNGTGNLVEVSLPQPATPVKLLRDEGADGVYENLDRFGRIKTQHWKAAATTVERVDYTYDTAGNRLLRDVPVAGRDQSYSYDKLHRLRGSNQGTWNGSSIPSPIQQLWNLDLLGNWNNLTEVPGISQNRTHNNAHEILSLNSSSTSVAHDESGNLTRVPRQADWSNYFELKYDAWNRLTEVKLGTTVIGSYAYDGLHRRISRTFAVGSTTTTEQSYYNEKWQCIEVRTGTESGPTTQKYVWHPYYIDALAARYWDGNGDNDVIDANESHFPLHDGNFNVTALLDSAGTLFERYLYSAYGQLSVFDAAWAAQTSSIVANPYTYTGRQYDAESGIYQYRYRYYHAQLGRFVGRDPAGYGGDGMNLIAYIKSSPINAVDPTGFFWGIPPWISPYTYPWGIHPSDIPESPSSRTPGKQFLVCMRLIRGYEDDPCTACVGIEHQYIQYGEVDSNGEPLAGTEGIGIGESNGPGSLPKPELFFHPTTRCEARNRMKGNLARPVVKPCALATDAEIWNCLTSHPMRLPYRKLEYDCMNWASEAAEACCLTKCPMAWFKYWKDIAWPFDPEMR